MYTDHYLRFADQAEAEAVLFEGEGEQRAPRYNAIDVIGTIHAPTGNLIATAEGDVPELAALDGWHVNVRHAGEAPALQAYAVEVSSPVRAWA